MIKLNNKIPSARRSPWKQLLFIKNMTIRLKDIKFANNPLTSDEVTVGAVTKYTKLDNRSIHSLLCRFPVQLFK